MAVRTIEDILADQRKIVDGAEGRSLTDDEVTNFENFEKELKAVQKSEEIRSRQAAYEAPNTSALVVTGADPKKDDTLERAFEHYMRTGRENSDLTELRAQSEGVGSEGGYTVPDGFRQKIVERLKAYGGLAGVVDELTTSTGTPLNWPTIDDTANLGEIVQEGGTFSSGADLVFGTASLGAYSYATGGASGNGVRVSWELLQDSSFDVQALVAKLLGIRIGRIQAVHLVSGTGSAQPQGIVDGLTGIQTAANNALTYADLVNYIHSVDPAYRENGRWAFNDGALEVIRKLVDGNNRPLLQPADGGAATGSPGGETLLGYPVTIDQAFSDFTNNSATINWGVFGDLREGYLVRRVRDVQLVVDPITRSKNRQTEFTAWARMDAVQQNTNAYVALTGKV